MRERVARVSTVVVIGQNGKWQCQPFNTTTPDGITLGSAVVDNLNKKR